MKDLIFFFFFPCCCWGWSDQFLRTRGGQQLRPIIDIVGNPVYIIFSIFFFLKW